MRWCVLLVAGLVAVARLAADPRPTQSQSQAIAPATRILLLHQFGTNRLFRPGFDAAFNDELHKAHGLTFDLYTETIESERFPGEEQGRVLADFLRRKYAGRRMDVIVAMQDDALAFAREHREVFGNPPIVALASVRGEYNSEDNITGLQGGLSYGGTVDLAQTLFPDTNRVVIVDGIRGNTGDIENEVRRQLDERRRTFTLEYLRNRPLADLLDRVGRLPPRSVVFVIRQTMRDEKHDVDPIESLGEIARASSAPVFYLNELGLGRGIVGGDMWRFEADARRLAVLAGRIAGGTRPHDVPVEFVTTVPMLDWLNCSGGACPPLAFLMVRLW